jgi:hypothetical protein
VPFIFDFVAVVCACFVERPIHQSVHSSFRFGLRMASSAGVVLPHDVAERVLKELNVVWDQVGLSETARKETIQQLSEQVRKIFEDKLAEEKLKLHSLQEDIQKKIATISNLEMSVGVDLKVQQIRADNLLFL